jgi:two-component sensor histidine kinase
MIDKPATRILYIDDDLGISRLVQRRLDAAGFAVTLAETGERGLALASIGAFEAVALDHYMPGRDGLDVLGDLRLLPNAPPVVFVTAAEEPRIAIAALKEGAADYVVKDVQGSFLELLGPTLRQAIEQAQLRREKEAAEREVRESRDRLERLANQQRLLLREVNHRVANSLQLISSLIELQARRVGDEQARGMLRRAAERVEAVALVHRRLYTSSDIKFVEMDQYLAGMIDEFRRALESDGGERQIALAAEPVRMETDKAVSIGLIVNELLTNAIKYAYPPGTRGAVRVSLAQSDGGDGRTSPTPPATHAGPPPSGSLRLVVEDDGVGYPPAGAPAKGSGLGAMIVQAMAETLGATITLDRDWHGTRFVVDVAG